MAVTNLLKLKGELAELEKNLKSLDNAETSQDVSAVERKAFIQSTAIVNYALSLRNELPAAYREARNRVFASRRARAMSDATIQVETPAAPAEAEPVPVKTPKAKKAKKAKKDA